MSPIAPAIQGINSAFTRFARESEELLKSVSGESDAEPASALVGQIEAKTQIAASVRTLNVADEMLQELLTLQE